MVGMELRLNLFLNSALDGGGWKAALPGRFYPSGKSLLRASNRKLYEPHKWSWLLRDENLENDIGSGTTWILCLLDRASL